MYRGWISCLQGGAGYGQGKPQVLAAGKDTSPLAQHKGHGRAPDVGGQLSPHHFLGTRIASPDF
jgi:hypothetical protein